MPKIFNYTYTNHFLDRMNERGICKYLISLCLARGFVIKKIATKLTYQLSLNQLKEAVWGGYIDSTDYLGLYSLTVVVNKNILITTYARYSDVGLEKIA